MSTTSEALAEASLPYTLADVERIEAEKAKPYTRLRATVLAANSAIGNALEAHGEIASLRADLASAEAKREQLEAQLRDVEPLSPMSAEALRRAQEQLQGRVRELEVDLAAGNVSAALATEREGLQLLLLDEETAHQVTMQERDRLGRELAGCEVQRDAARDTVNFGIELRKKAEAERDAARADAARKAEALREVTALLHEGFNETHAACNKARAALSDTSALEWLAARERKVAERVRDAAAAVSEEPLNGAVWWDQILHLDLDALLRGEKP